MFPERCLPCLLSHVGVLCGYSLYFKKKKMLLGDFLFRYFLICPSLGATWPFNLASASPATVFLSRSRREGRIQRVYEHGPTLSQLAPPWLFLVGDVGESRADVSALNNRLSFPWLWNETCFFLFLWMLHGQARVAAAYGHYSPD